MGLRFRVRQACGQATMVSQRFAFGSATTHPPPLERSRSLHRATAESEKPEKRKNAPRAVSETHKRCGRECPASLDVFRFLAFSLFRFPALAYATLGQYLPIPCSPDKLFVRRSGRVWAFATVRIRFVHHPSSLVECGGHATALDSGGLRRAPASSRAAGKAAARPPHSKNRRPRAAEASYALPLFRRSITRASSRQLATLNAQR